MNTNNTVKHINQMIAFLLTIATTIVVLLFLNLIPNKLNTDYILNNMIVDISNFVPELSEKLQYIFGNHFIYLILFLIYEVTIQKLFTKIPIYCIKFY